VKRQACRTNCAINGGKPGRNYEDASKAFQPYNETKEVNNEARSAGAKLIRAGKSGKETHVSFHQ
jgi:hypothetical protein